MSAHRIACLHGLDGSFAAIARVLWTICRRLTITLTAANIGRSVRRAGAPAVNPREVTMCSASWMDRRAVPLVLTLTLFAVACTDSTSGPVSTRVGLPDVVAAAQAGKVDICHVAGAQANILEVGAPALGEHLSHGDYVTTLRVSRQSGPAGDGIHFNRIGAALDAARAGRLARGELMTAACRITIVASAELYPGSTATDSPDEERFPMIVDVPDLTLRGALAMDLDASGRVLGSNATTGETTLAPTVPLPFEGGVSTPLIIANAHPGGSAGNGLVVEGFVFRSGHSGVGTDAGGQGVLAVRVRDLVVRGNRFEAGFTESIDLRATSGDVVQNQLGGTAGTCDVCLAGPGRYRANGNKLAAGGIPGMTVSGMVGLPVPSGVEPLALTPTAETWAEIRNNEVRDHLRTPVGVGLRVEAVGTMAPNVRNTIHAVLQDNLLVNNRFGMIVHAGFPVAGSALQADVSVRLGGNAIQQSCQAKLLVTLSRHQRSLGLNPNPPYLLDSNYRLELGGDLSWDAVWFDHPAGLGNSLIVDGATISNGARHFYSATGCPGL